MRLSRMIDHIKPLFRPKSDQQFSHSLGTERTLRSTADAISFIFRERKNALSLAVIQRQVNPYLLWVRGR